LFASGVEGVVSVLLREPRWLGHDLMNEHDISSSYQRRRIFPHRNLALEFPSNNQRKTVCVNKPEEYYKSD
jgi:hypothetical protein